MPKTSYIIYIELKALLKVVKLKKYIKSLKIKGKIGSNKKSKN